MATWEDGPEYAPLVRPREYAPAPNSALESAPPQAETALSPAFSPPPQRPGGYQQRDQAPLSTLMPNPGPQRDALQPFNVVATNMTGMGSLNDPMIQGSPAPASTSPSSTAAWTAPQPTNTAWNSVHWSPPAESAQPPPHALNHSDPQRPFETSPQHQHQPQPQQPQTWPGLASLQEQGPAVPQRPAQAAPNWPPPLGPVSGQVPGQGGNPWASPQAGGSPYYAAPADVPVPTPQTGGEFLRAVVVGIGLAPLICLALGLFPALAPLALVAAFFLRRTGTIAKARISQFYYTGIGIVIIGSAASMLLSYNPFLTAVSQAAWFVSVLLLLASFLAVSAELRSGRSQPPPSSQWG